MLIADPPLRKKLQQMEDISIDLLDEVRQKVPWLIPILEPLSGIKFKDVSPCWRRLIKDVTANSSVTGMVGELHPSLQLLRSTSSITNFEQIQQFKDLIPCVYDVLKEDLSSITRLTPLFDTMSSKISYLITFAPHVLPLPAVDNKQLDCVPYLKPICSRGLYAMDKSVTAICNKKAPMHKTLTPGIFTISCIHGKFLLSKHIILWLTMELILRTIIMWSKNENICRLQHIAAVTWTNYHGWWKG